MPMKILPDTYGQQTRMDALETGLFEDDLDQVIAEQYDEKFPDLQMRQLVPAGPRVDPGARTFSARRLTGYGTWRVIEGYSRELPRSDLSATEFEAPTRWIGNSWGWNWMEQQEARFARLALLQERAQNARLVIEEGLDYIIAFGLPSHGIYGFLNNPNVTLSAVATVGADTTWTQKALSNPQLILDDIAEAVDLMRTTTKSVEKPNRLLVSDSSFALLARTFLSTNYAASLLSLIPEQFPGITVASSRYLETSGTGGTKLMILYRFDRRALYYVIPMEFNALPAWQCGPTEWIIPNVAKSGGTVVVYPQSMQYRYGM